MDFNSVCIFPLIVLYLRGGSFFLPGVDGSLLGERRMLYLLKNIHFSSDISYVRRSETYDYR